MQVLLGVWKEIYMLDGGVCGREVDLEFDIWDVFKQFWFY